MRIKEYASNKSVEDNQKNRCYKFYDRRSETTLFEPFSAIK